MEDKLMPLAGVSSDPGIQATWISTSWRARRAYHAAKYVRLLLLLYL